MVPKASPKGAKGTQKGVFSVTKTTRLDYYFETGRGRGATRDQEKARSTRKNNVPNFAFH